MLNYLQIKIFEGGKTDTPAMSDGSETTEFIPGFISVLSQEWFE